ncbi:MAG: hypothetical protein V5B31_04780 [Candidatus Accumulibacter propinquus]|uniref:hypothetical protein n=1 Tax=Candidatus Accumulibacter propinquus TaxID=2954380 RepID=UPI002FC2AF36
MSPVFLRRQLVAGQAVGVVTRCGPLVAADCPGKETQCLRVAQQPGQTPLLCFVDKALRVANTMVVAQQGKNIVLIQRFEQQHHRLSAG